MSEIQIIAGGAALGLGAGATLLALVLVVLIGWLERNGR